MSKWLKEKKQVIETALRMLEKGLVTGTSGNISQRLVEENGRELLAITPTSRYYDLLNPDDIQIIDFEAEPVEGDLPPSSETMLHIGIYQVRKDICAVIHTHSVYASAVAVTHRKIPPILDDQIITIGGEINLAEYAPSGSDALVHNVIQALGNKNGILLMNHGALGAGKNLREAFTVCEIIEKTAQAYYLSLTMGEVNLLPAEAIKSGQAFFRTLHGINPE